MLTPEEKQEGKRLSEELQAKIEAVAKDYTPAHRLTAYIVAYTEELVRSLGPITPASVLVAIDTGAYAMSVSLGFSITTAKERQEQEAAAQAAANIPTRIPTDPSVN